MLIEDKRVIDMAPFEDIDDGDVFVFNEEGFEKRILMKTSDGRAVDLENGEVFDFSDEDMVRVIEVKLQRYS